MRSFEYADGTSKKFWEISTSGPSLTVRYGRIGTAGQTKTKDLESAVAASVEMDRLIREKVKKGYVEMGGAAVPSPPAVDAVLSESVTATLKALADIKEWFTDQGATSVLDELNGPATEEQLAAVEKQLGHPIPPELAALYRTHDGQRNVDGSGNLFFAYGTGWFLPLGSVVYFSNSMIPRFLSPWHDESTPPSVREDWHKHPPLVSPEQEVPLTWIHLYEERRSTPFKLLREECSTAWLVFGWEQNFSGIVNLRTGRVFEWAKDEGLHFAAESFGAFLVDYADNLWNGKHKLSCEDSSEDEPPVWTWQ